MRRLPVVLENDVGAGPDVLIAVVPATVLSVELRQRLEAVAARQRGAFLDVVALDLVLLDDVPGDGRTNGDVSDGLAGPQDLLDLVLLDVMLPGKNGIDLCREIRGRSGVPIIFISARADETDRVVGLELGADDYIPKPVSTRELLARVRAVLRRGPLEKAVNGERNEKARFAGWEVDLRRRCVFSPSGASIELTGAEFDLLLTDVIMPGGMTGYQLADELRQAKPGLKILFTSGYTELATAGEQAALKDPLLSKPYRKQDLGAPCDR